MRSTTWFGAIATPLVFVWLGCNAIIGLDPGEPTGGGGHTSSSSTADTASSNSTAQGGSSGVSGTTGAGTSSGGSSGGCNAPSDCPMAAECQTATCDQHECGTKNSSSGSVCTNGGKVCNADGHCVECNGDYDCTAPATCQVQLGVCVSPQCMDGNKDGMETGVDCGGPMCPPCATGDGCVKATDCAGGVCDGTGHCVDCMDVTDCSVFGNAYCSMGTCVAQLAQGAPCTTKTSCLTGYCVDGVCCNSSCTEPCTACSAAAKGHGSDGSCFNVSQGLDPHDDCNGMDGYCDADTCDGTGVCNASPMGAMCGLTCDGSTIVGAGMCDDQGDCQGMITDCSPYACSDTPACLTSCSGGGDCADSAFCNVGGVCTPKLGTGGACTHDYQCVSDNCEADVCASN